ncbi:hypothetical protein Tco_0753443 [Tanacetum coccineum]
MSMSVGRSQVHKVARSQDDDKRLCLVDDLKEVQVRIQVKLNRTRLSLKSKITTSCSQDNVKKTRPGLQSMTPATSSSGLVTNPIPQQPCNPPKRDNWDRLFQHMFDEYFNPPTIDVSLVPVAAAPRVVDLADSPVST